MQIFNCLLSKLLCLPVSPCFRKHCADVQLGLRDFVSPNSTSLRQELEAVSEGTKGQIWLILAAVHKAFCLRTHCLQMIVFFRHSVQCQQSLLEEKVCLLRIPQHIDGFFIQLQNLRCQIHISPK